MATIETKTDPQVASSLAVWQELVRGSEVADYAIRFWDGTTWSPQPGREPGFTLVLNHPGAVRRMFWPPRPLTTGQAFVYDDFNVEGDMLAFADLCRHLANLKGRLSLGQKLRLGWKLYNLPKLEKPREGRSSVRLTGRKHSKERDRQAISYHYDMSNEFFEIVLGEHMSYTSAVYADPNEDLRRAQERKMDFVCRKLRVKPGDRHLDIGCGWGGLIRWATQNYGTRSLGVTISQKQIEYAEPTLKALGDRCQVALSDYRDVQGAGTFDAISTIEVAEHFGREMLPVYFRKCYELLRPGGSLLIQQICQTFGVGAPAAREFSDHYIFPDGELTPLSTFVQLAEQTGFEVRDVEGFRESYVLTLKAWLQNLEANHDNIVRATDEATYRVFRLFFAGACQGFENNIFNVYQILMVKPDGPRSGYPLLSNDWQQTDNPTSGGLDARRAHRRD